MKNTVKENTLFTLIKAGRVLVASALILTVSACGDVDKDDGDVVNSIELPTDSFLTLHCPDAGIAGNACILDDPENPYAFTSVNDDTKFDLNTDAPSAKARFYLWATAQAMSPRGENQFYVANALHEMYSESDSELAKAQALRAYRSVLDNYFNSATFFECNFGGCPEEDLFFPHPVRKLVGVNMVSPSAPLTALFDTPTEALSTFGEWGYTYDDQVSGDFTQNF